MRPFIAKVRASLGAPRDDVGTTVVRCVDLSRRCREERQGAQAVVSFNLQAWCDDCEALFLREGEMTKAFRAFNDMQMVCDLCYASLKQRHSKMQSDDR